MAGPAGECPCGLGDLPGRGGRTRLGWKGGHGAGGARMRRLTRLLAAVLMAAALALLPQAPASAGPGPALTLLAQTPWVLTQGDFELRLGLNGVSPEDQLQVTVYDRLVTRTGFEEAASGQVRAVDYYSYQQTVPIDALTPDPAGGVDVVLPVDEPSPSGDPFASLSIDKSEGVFPVQVQLLGAQGSKGAAVGFTTFLTYSQGTAHSQGFTPLSVALILPYSSPLEVNSQGQLEPPAGAEATRLGQLAAALASGRVPASLLADPATLRALSAPGAPATDARTLASLASISSGPTIQTLPVPWSPVSLGDLVQAGLPGEISEQLTAADSTLRATLARVPSRRTWVVDGPLDATTLTVLLDAGATRLIVPDGDLTPLSAEVTTTFTHASTLGSVAGNVSVYGADSGLTADFVRPVSPVLSANILLADLAMIFTETPGDTYARGVAALPPPDWVANPQFVSTVLAGLAGNPLLSAVTAGGLFQAAPTALGTRLLADPEPPATMAEQALAAAAPAISSARTRIATLSALLPSSSAVVADLSEQVLLAESESLSPPARRAALAAVARATAVVNHAVSLPPPTSMTLTATKGQVPITILASGSLHPRVELVLRSQRLIFEPFQPPGGTCSVPTPTLETCLLSLKTQNTTLKVPVETRSSGVFPLSVELYPPGSSLAAKPLAADQDTVRSTAVSTVAIVLIFLALAGLAIWWGRDLRRGRRPKGMLPSPFELDRPGGLADLDEFFRVPPPDFGRGAADRMSPSAAVWSPTRSTDTLGAGQETRDQWQESE
jgi:hypothetical protein